MRYAVTLIFVALMAGSLQAQPAKDYDIKEILQALPDDSLAVMAYRPASKLAYKLRGLTKLPNVAMPKLESLIEGEKKLLANKGFYQKGKVVFVLLENPNDPDTIAFMEIIPVVDYQTYVKNRTPDNGKKKYVVFPALNGKYAVRTEEKMANLAQNALQSGRQKSYLSSWPAWLNDKDLAAHVPQRGLKYLLRASAVEYKLTRIAGQLFEHKPEEKYLEKLYDQVRKGEALDESTLTSILYFNMALVAHNISEISVGGGFEKNADVRFLGKIAFIPGGKFAQVAASEKSFGQKLGANLPDVPFVFATDENFSPMARKVILPLLVSTWLPLVNDVKSMLYWRDELAKTSRLADLVKVTEKTAKMSAVGLATVDKAASVLMDLPRIEGGLGQSLGEGWLPFVRPDNGSIKAEKANVQGKNAVKVQLGKNASAKPSKQVKLIEIKKKDVFNIQNVTGFLTAKNPDTLAFGLAATEPEAEKLLQAVQQNNSSLLNNALVKKTLALLPNQAQAIFLGDLQRWKEVTSPGKQERPDAAPLGAIFHFVPNGAEVNLVIPAETVAIVGISNVVAPIANNIKSVLPIPNITDGTNPKKEK